jgi:uncharacterized protein (TIGR02147 family)
LRARKRANPAYSERAFARDLEIAPHRLNEVLHGKQGLSPAVAVSLAKRLHLSEEEENYFVDLVRASHARSAEERAEAQTRLDEKRARRKARALDLATLQCLSDWLPFAILELTTVRGFRPKARWVAERLGVDEVRVKAALQNLVGAKLIAVTKEKWTPLAANTLTAKGVPSRAVKDYHRHVMSRAVATLYRHAMARREFSSLVFAVDDRHLPELKQHVRDFLFSINEKFRTVGAHTDVACLAVQLFCLTEPSDSDR